MYAIRSYYEMYKDLSMTTSIIRDLLRDDVEKVLVNSKKLYKEISIYLKYNSPEFLNKIELYKDSKPLFVV